VIQPGSENESIGPGRLETAGVFPRLLGFVAKLRVSLADDRAVVREGLKALVNAQPDMEVIGEAADSQAVCEAGRLEISVKTEKTYKACSLEKARDAHRGVRHAAQPKADVQQILCPIIRA
jgi:hypothetical protein